MKRMEVMGKNKKSTVNQNTNDLTVYKVGAAFALLVLSLLALHLGEIPDGTAYSVRKDNVQQEMLDVAMSHWDGVRNRVDGAERRTLRRTPMSWKHRGVWQEEGTGTVHTFDEGLADIIVAEPDGIDMADGLMVCDDGGGLAVIYPAEGVMAEAVRNLLEQVTLA